VPTPSLRFQDYEFNLKLSSGLWRWTTRVDLSGALPSYFVRDIQTPWGSLVDATDLPGLLVKEMADSIDQVKTAFMPEITVGGVFTFNVDEGRGFSNPLIGTVTNTGTFGSLLGVTVASSAPWLVSSPAALGGIAYGNTGNFETRVDSTNLLAIDSPYTGTLTFQDPDATNNPQVANVTVNVRPRPTIAVSVPEVDFTVVRPIDGVFPFIPSAYFILNNTGSVDSNLEYQIQKLIGCSNWLASFVPATGNVAGGASQRVDITVRPPIGMGTGTYTEILRVSGFSTNDRMDVTVKLVVT